LQYDPNAKRTSGLFPVSFSNRSCDRNVYINKCELTVRPRIHIPEEGLTG